MDRIPRGLFECFQLISYNGEMIIQVHLPHEVAKLQVLLIMSRNRIPVYNNQNDYPP